MKTLQALCQTIQCRCGKVKISIDSPDVLRMVCYCKDCRGYYNTLNGAAKANNREEAATLDKWGGADYTNLYPSEMKVLEGKDLLTTCIIREGSKINRVYASCCDTPMYSIGPSTSALVNTNLVDEANKPDVRFRIIGRDALPGDGTEKRPSMSWSVPFSFFWVMPGRIRKKLATPMPVEIPKDVKVLENFKKG